MKDPEQLPATSFTPDAIGHYIWATKYRWQQRDEVYDKRIEDTWLRVARAAAAVEDSHQDVWQQRFYALLENFSFLPGGRILAGAGTDLRVTLFNCFVMGLIGDDMEGIFDSLKEAALTLQAGGGVGYDFSTLRPHGSIAKASGNIASGPVSFMLIWNAMCDTLLSTGARRGAMLASLRCDHPDIEAFIHAKRDRGALNHFNLSVQISDDFMRAVADDADWPLVFPLAAISTGSGMESVMRSWPGFSGPVPCAVLAHKPARRLWQQIMQATYAMAEPGVLFTDRINAMNNLYYREHITCTNPCGEVPLPPYGACNLGSINLTRFVRQPFTSRAELDMKGIQASVTIATRFLDNIIDCSALPLPAQREASHGSRRIGLGISGLADALIMLGLRYDSQQARLVAGQLMQKICHGAYHSSIGLAREKGSFPFFDREAYLKSAFIQRLPAGIRRQIATDGIRNSHLLAIAPTGTISLLAGNISSGIEAVFAFTMTRRILDRQGNYQLFELEDHAYRQWREAAGDAAQLPAQFITAQQVSPRDQLRMQSALQKHVDSAISKTITVPGDFPFADFRDLYLFAFEHGLKGCTTYRPDTPRGEVLSRDDA
ncbi:MAG: adenosylcobalamin-dependent ribonucleoside-diphosphate reductase [Pseudomonadales bacterium]|nr:adenosylcobalamin-dependent ribonucleoside-diphosphate reductase [Pseudomonadales bacterium]